MIKLRKFNLSDLEILYNLFINDKVLKNLLISFKAKEITLKMEKDWLRKVEKEYKSKKPESYHLAITLNNKLIGSIGANHIDYNNNSVEIGYWLGEEFWGNGSGTESIKKFCEELNRQFSFKRIEAYPFTHNKASARVLEKTGFKCEGIKRKAYKKRDKYMDSWMYSKIY
ncbi:GNAT family N-acetyltransferase [Candidatus Woesearchaeota archaeon]|nr:GNAT family N-acetyltransferase [Candidatus Woesearchaeota archaeon]